LASAPWYARLAQLLGPHLTAAATIGLATELLERLGADNLLILRFPQDASPQLLYSRIDPVRRANRIDDYLLGHYALDPFYIRLEYCCSQEVTSLRDVIEEDFAASEYYKTHYRAAGLLDELCFCCSEAEAGYLNLSLSRAVGRNHFNPAELAAARALAPLINQALRTTWRDFASEAVIADGDLREERHRHIENARRNFGRSVLTSREFEILQYLLHGKSVDFIARRLDIAASTVKVHRKHIYSKLNVNSQAEIFTLLLEVVATARCEPGCDPLAQYLSYRKLAQAR
jgi:DNA-binding CsgD family transcriptional regulator